MILLLTYRNSEELVQKLTHHNELKKEELETATKTQVMIFMLVYTLLTMGFLILVLVLPLKKLVGRDRPNRVKTVKRLCNLRDKENGNKSMPSGDSAAAAFVFTMYCLSFHLPRIFALFGIVWVCLGRVFMHCHWIGDTVIGAALGTAMASVFFGENFSKFGLPVFLALNQ